MGVLACYTCLSDEKLKEIIKCKEEDLVEKVEEVIEALSDKSLSYDMDKLWDGLHFLLTGITAGEPIEDDSLSEAIVGVSNLSEDDFISSINSSEVAKILKALKVVDVEKLRSNFSIIDFKKNKIYPNIWVEADKESLLEELISELKNLIKFYEKVLDMKQNVVVSIY